MSEHNRGVLENATHSFEGSVPLNNGQKTNLLHRIYESPVRVAFRANGALVSPLRKLSLRAQARVHGGKISFGSEDRIICSARFQGRGRVVIGNNTEFGFSMGGSAVRPTLLAPHFRESSIQVGDGCRFNSGCQILAASSVRIGDRCLIGADTRITDADWHGSAPDRRAERGSASPVTIEDNVFIGMEAIILKGVRIGKDAIVGAGCVVSRDVPAGSVVVGNPMRIVKSLYT